jgi:hypothetical protein
MLMINEEKLLRSKERKRNLRHSTPQWERPDVSELSTRSSAIIQVITQ